MDFEAQFMVDYWDLTCTLRVVTARRTTIRGVTMKGCPNREQISALTAIKAAEMEGSEIWDHVQTCPKCREFLGSLSQDATTEFASPYRDDRATFGSPTFSVVEPTVGDDSPPTIGEINGASAPAETVQFSSCGPATVLETQVSVATETAVIPSSAWATFQNTAEFDPTDWPPSPTALTVHVETSVDDAGAASDKTTDYTQEQEPRARRRSSRAKSASVRRKDGPADYQIVKELGRGGMGIVYKALDRRLNRLVALKMIRGGGYADDIQIARFKIEAEAVAALRHPNILQIYDIGESDGEPYVALELLEGGSLAERMRGRALAPREAAECVVPLVLAMDTAHRAGIVHRDLKPANILFTSDGIPKITDFGLAKRLEADEGQTHTGQVMGTPSYMAPEQARGDTKAAGPPADIYALGAILYEMLIGRPPFKGTSAMDTVKQVLEEEPVSPSRVQGRVPRDLETICMKCLQKEPRKRYASAKEMADDLSRYLHGETILARRTPLLERGVKWARRRPTVATLLGLGIVSAIALLATGAWYWNHKRLLERNAALHEESLKDETAVDLIQAKDAMSKKSFDSALGILTHRKTILDNEKNQRLANLHRQTNEMLQQVDDALKGERALQAKQRENDEVQRRYRRFLDLRKEALFRDTKFTGLALATNIDRTREAAEEALGVFGHRQQDDSLELRALPAELSSEQRAEVEEGCHELQLILAEVVADSSPSQVDRALRILESSERSRPDHSRAYHLRKAALLARKNDHAGEAQELEQAKHVQSETAFDYYLSGQEEYKRYNFAAAIQNLEGALRRKPGNFWAEYLKAICYLRTSQFEGAKSCLDACLQTDPKFAWLYLFRGYASGQLGDRYLKQGMESPQGSPPSSDRAKFEFDEAEADLQEALERLKRAPDKELQYVLLMNRGLIRFQRGRIDQAAADFREAVGLNHNAFLAHANLAYVYQKQDMPAAAIDEFSKAIALRPDWPPLYRGRAELQQTRSDPTPASRAAALIDLEMAILHERDDNPALALDHTNRAKLLFRAARFREALEEVKLALAVLPDRVDARVVQDALVLRINALHKLKKYNEAIQACDSALAKGKRSAELYELRGTALADRGDYRSAIRDYGLALELHPEPARLQHLLCLRGWAYLVCESPTLALADFEAALKHDLSDGDAHNGRGTAHARLGDRRAAIADAREALRYSKADHRVTYNAARIFAMASSIAASEVGENARVARALASEYQDIALHLVREAFGRQAPENRAAFWRDTVQKDPALKPIRRRLKFEELVASQK
jgi:serine/threonine protein kinase/Flp pilus assembly protein TadD